MEFSGGTWQAGVQEAAGVFKRSGTYYYFTSLCNGWKSSQTRYRTASSMAGPWTANAIVPTNPLSENSFDTQHDFVLPIAGPSSTTYVFFGDRWTNFRAPSGAEDVGRYGWFPLSFDVAGVPTINAPNYASNGGDWELQIGQAAPVADQVQNPGFEADFQYWSATGNASIATAAAEVHSGTKALKSWSSDPYVSSVQNASMTNVPAGTYTASVWSRAGGSFTRRAFEVYVNDVKVSELSLPATTTWTRYSIPISSVPASARIKLGVALNANGGAWTQFDDFALNRN
jgi:hypothetical protein